MAETCPAHWMTIKHIRRLEGYLWSREFGFSICSAGQDMQLGVVSSHPNCSVYVATCIFEPHAFHCSPPALCGFRAAFVNVGGSNKCFVHGGYSLHHSTLPTNQVPIHQALPWVSRNGCDEVSVFLVTHHRKIFTVAISNPVTENSNFFCKFGK